MRVTSPDLKDIQGAIDDVVLGEITTLTALDGLTDWGSVKKVSFIDSKNHSLLNDIYSTTS